MDTGQWRCFSSLSHLDFSRDTKNSGLAASCIGGCGCKAWIVTHDVNNVCSLVTLVNVRVFSEES